MSVLTGSFNLSTAQLKEDLFFIEENAGSEDPKIKEKVKSHIRFVGKQLGDIRSLDSETLELAQRALGLYLIHKPTGRSIQKIFKAVTGTGSRQIAEKSLNRVSNTLEQNNIHKFDLIRGKIQEWRGMPKEKLREDMRAFIMDACQGGVGIAPCSMESLELDIKNRLSKEDGMILEQLNDPHLFSAYELKTGTYSGNPPRLDACIVSKLESGQQRLVVSDQDVEEAIMKMEKERSFRLKNLNTIYDKTIFEPDQAVNKKFFQTTTAWYVGSLQNNPDAIPFEREMQQIGAAHNIVCITDLNTEHLDGKQDTLLLQDKVNASYPQDFVDFSSNEVRIPLMNHGKYPQVGSVYLSNFTQRTRIERDFDWSEESRLSTGEVNPYTPISNMATIGLPWTDNLANKSVKLALGLGATPVMNLTYSEGGNTLIGAREDGTPFIIIGKDSYEFSKLLMEKELGRKMSESEVKKAFALDYGIMQENIFFVEQPGDFHLDMNLAIVGGNTVIVNDAVMAKELFNSDQEEWIRTNFPNLPEESQVFEGLRGLEKGPSIELAEEGRDRRAEGKKRFEDKTAEDLIAQGFNVVRFPGSFEYQPPNDRPIPCMNFFNMVTAATPDGDKIVVAMGTVNKKYETLFHDMLSYGDQEIDKVYFLDREATQRSLTGHGGISCRSKTI
ncbi:MAG: hypothetical protein JSR93_09490 [Verrucomicrobia bacterium]|nr:hypothetical protein [Verrucomicrobiota bacterium]